MWSEIKSSVKHMSVKLKIDMQSNVSDLLFWVYLTILFFPMD